MRKLALLATFFMVGFLCGGKAAYAADTGDILGAIAGVVVIHEILEGNEHQHTSRCHHGYRNFEREWNTRRNRAWSRTGDGRYYEGDIHDAYRRHFPCGQQYTGVNGCIREGRRVTEIIEETRTIIITR